MGGPDEGDRQDRYGSPDVLELRETAKPEAGDSEVLVRVRAAALNAYDWHLMRGDPYLARLSLGISRPKAKIRGRDFAGRVEAVGRDVKRLRPGDEVFGEADGAFAEYLCAPGDVMEPKPASLTFEQAAAVPLAGNTALIGLRDHGRLQPGQKVLINGASGGVGMFAVQIAKAFGAEVTGVCSTGNAELIRSIGADHVIDYTREDFARGGQRYDLVLDLVGNRSLAACRRVLAPRGTFVLIGGGVYEGGSLVGPMGFFLKVQALSPLVRPHRLRTFFAQPDGEHLAALSELIESGKVTPVIDRTYPLSEVPEAIRYLEDEHARAKVVITL